MQNFRPATTLPSGSIDGVVMYSAPEFAGMPQAYSMVPFVRAHAILAYLAWPAGLTSVLSVFW